jgi:Kdo2-lipid IVA lauroyltransferase/acyltransferase
MIDIKNSRQYRVIKNILRLGSFIPRRIMTLFAYPVGTIWYAIDGRHRKIAFDNMMKAFTDEITPARCRRLVKANFIQLTRVVLELPSLLRLNLQNIDSYVEFSGENHLKTALAEGKGVIFLTAHLGNWEMMGLAMPLKFGFSDQAHAMARPLDHKPMDAVLTEIRTRTGNRVIDKDKSAGLVGGLLRQNQKIAILLDQNASWFEGVYVPFFGRVACTNKGIAMLAIRYGAVVVPMFNIRQKNGRYKVMFDPPVKLIRTGDLGQDIVENTRRFNDIIEKYIRLAPENWLWVHRRWRIKGIPEYARKKVRGDVEFLSQ